MSSHCCFAKQSKKPLYTKHRCPPDTYNRMYARNNNLCFWKMKISWLALEKFIVLCEKFLLRLLMMASSTAINIFLHDMRHRCGCAKQNKISMLATSSKSVFESFKISVSSLNICKSYKTNALLCSVKVWWVSVYKKKYKLRIRTFSFSSRNRKKFWSDEYIKSSTC